MYERSMRIRTNGKFAYQEELVDDVTDLLGESTRVERGMTVHGEQGPQR